MSQRESTVALREQGLANKERDLTNGDAETQTQLTQTQRRLEQAIDKARGIAKERGLVATSAEKSKKSRGRGR